MAARIGDRKETNMPFSERLEEAFAWAHELHRDQTRKGSARPYITHLLSVAGIVAEYGGSEESIIAADKVHNVRSMIADYEDVGDSLWDRFHASREEIEWYHGAVLDALGEGWTHPILGVLTTAHEEFVDMRGGS